jgi:hypothetical protein
MIMCRQFWQFFTNQSVVMWWATHLLRAGHQTQGRGILVLLSASRFGFYIATECCGWLEPHTLPDYSFLFWGHCSFRVIVVQLLRVSIRILFVQSDQLAMVFIQVCNLYTFGTVTSTKWHILVETFNSEYW